MKIHYRLTLFLALIVSGCASTVSQAPETTILSTPAKIEVASVTPSGTDTLSPKVTVTPEQKLDLPPSSSSTPTALPDPPEPTSNPPRLSDLQVINRTNVNQLVPVWRFEPRNKQEEDWGAGFAFHPDGKTIAMRIGNHLELLDFETGQSIQTYNPSDFFKNRYKPYINALEFSPTGARLAALTSAGPVMWNTSTGKALWKADWGTFKNLDVCAGDFSAMAFSPAGDIIVTTAIAAGSHTCIWSAENGKLIKSLHTSNQVDADFSPDGSRFYTVDRFTDNINAWDTKTWEVMKPLHALYASSLTISPNGAMAAVNSVWNGDGAEFTTLYFMDGWKYIGMPDQSKKPGVIELGRTRTDPSFNIDGGIVAIAVGREYLDLPTYVELYDTSTVQRISVLDDSFPGPIVQVEFSPNGRLLAARSNNGTMIFWGVPTK